MGTAANMKPSAALILTLGLHLGTGHNQPLYLHRNRYTDQATQTSGNLPVVISARRSSEKGDGSGRTSQIVSQILAGLDQPITEAIDDYFKSQRVGSVPRGRANIDIASSSSGTRFNSASTSSSDSRFSSQSSSLSGSQFNSQSFLGGTSSPGSSFSAQKTTTSDRTSSVIKEVMSLLQVEIEEAVAAAMRSQSQTVASSSQRSTVDSLVDEIITTLTPTIRISVENSLQQLNSQSSASSLQSSVSSQSSTISSSLSQEGLVSKVMTILQPRISTLVATAVSQQQETRRREEERQLQEIRKQEQVRRQELIRRQEEIKRQEQIRRQEEIRREEEFRRQEEVRRQDEIRRQQQEAALRAEQQRIAERIRLEQQRAQFSQGGVNRGSVEDLFGIGLEISQANQDKEVLNIKLPGRESGRIG